MKLAVLLLALNMPLLLHASDNSSSGTEKGLQSLSLMDFSTASRDFSEEMRKAKPGSPEWETAALGYAVCLHRRQPDRESDKSEAARLYKQIIAGKSGSMNYQLALLFSGDLAARSDYFGDRPEQEKAIERYNTLIENFPKSPLVPYAVLYRAQTKVFLKSQERSREAVDELQAWLKVNPNNPIASVHWLFISDVLYHPLEDFIASAGALLEGEAAGLPPGIQKDEYWWRIANIALKGNDKGIAERYFSKLSELEYSKFKTPAKDKLDSIRRLKAATLSRGGL
jgi:tetratricopeptide (TPR) repeat protein